MPPKDLQWGKVAAYLADFKYYCPRYKRLGAGGKAEREELHITERRSPAFQN